jgi:hypothetical protein
MSWWQRRFGSSTCSGRVLKSDLMRIGLRAHSGCFKEWPRKRQAMSGKAKSMSPIGHTRHISGPIFEYFVDLLTKAGRKLSEMEKEAIWQAIIGD